jgi:hypothetical protein
MTYTKMIESYGCVRVVDITSTLLIQKLKDTATDPSKSTNEERMSAIKGVRDKFLAALMLNEANKARFSTLKGKLSNQFGFGNNLCPKTPDQCLTMLNCCVDLNIQPPCATAPPPTPCNAPKPKDEALIFAQGANKNKKPSGAAQQDDHSSHTSSSSTSTTHQRVMNVQYKTCGKLGHTSSVCPDAKPPAQVHAMTGVDDTSVVSDEESVIILAQVAVPATSLLSDKVIMTQGDEPDCHPINFDLILVDSQLTVDIFSNPNT